MNARDRRDDLPDAPREDRDLLAAELAMGLIDGEEAARAQALLQSDAEFARLHVRWRERLHEIDQTAAPAPAQEALWSRIVNSLDEAATGQAPARTPVLATDFGARLGERLSGWWSSLQFWRPVGLTAALASLILALSLGYFMREAARQPVLVAVLMTDANQPGAIVNVLADGRAELVPLTDIQVPAGRALQIWTLWDRVRGPVSVGLSRSARRIDLDIKSLPRTVPSQLFEITLEPEGGSPTGRPTGPVLMKGNATTAL